MQNQIIVRFTDGKVMKGTTADLFPNKAVKAGGWCTSWTAKT